MSIQPFHLAIPVKDLESTRKFYGEILELKEGRASEHWIDWDFFGHQLSTHVKPEETKIIPPIRLTARMFRSAISAWF